MKFGTWGVGADKAKATKDRTINWKKYGCMDTGTIFFYRFIYIFWKKEELTRVFILELAILNCAD